MSWFWRLIEWLESLFEHRPKPPTQFHLTITKGNRMALDVVGSWLKSPSANVQQYTVAWTRNGAALNPSIVPQSTTADNTGYGADFGTANPTVVLSQGDVIAGSLIAQDTVNNLASTPVSATVTIPTTPPPPTAPLPPTGFTLTVTGP
jgi:hypothetical protein